MLRFTAEVATFIGKTFSKTFSLEAGSATHFKQRRKYGRAPPSTINSGNRVSAPFTPASNSTDRYSISKIIFVLLLIYMLLLMPWQDSTAPEDFSTLDSYSFTSSSSTIDYCTWLFLRVQVTVLLNISNNNAELSSLTLYFIDIDTNFGISK